MSRKTKPPALATRAARRFVRLSTTNGLLNSPTFLFAQVFRSPETGSSNVRASGFRELYCWLAGNDALVVRADRREPLVVLPLRRALTVLLMAEKYRTAEGAT
jgi:hypothetical protein